MFIVSATSLLLAGLRETADAFHIADDTGKVVEVLAVAFGTFMEIAFVNVTTVVADGVGDVECEVVTAFLCSHAEQLAVLRLREVLLQIGV